MSEETTSVAAQLVELDALKARAEELGVTCGIFLTWRLTGSQCVELGRAALEADLLKHRQRIGKHWEFDVKFPRDVVGRWLCRLASPVVPGSSWCSYCRIEALLVAIEEVPEHGA